MNQINEILERWLFKKEIYNDMKDKFSKISKISKSDVSNIVNAFISRLNQIDYKFTKSEQLSGAVCFFGGVFISLLHYGYIEQIEGLFTFSLSYMLIDHYLDDNNISDIEKKQTMKEIYNFLTYEDNTKNIDKNTNNKLINIVKDRYLKLIKDIPLCKEYILKLFKSEWKGSEISSRCDLSRQEYKNIAIEKGGLTSATIACILGLEPQGDNTKIGSIIQLIDDLIDIEDDISLHIYTLARYDLQNNNLDEYVIETILEINKLSSVYNFFKPILLLGLVLGIHDNPGCITSELGDVIQKYDPFSFSTSKYTLTEWFHQTLIV